MINSEVLKKETIKFFKENYNLDVVVDGEAIKKELENAEANEISRVESVYFIDNKKYIVFYNIDVKYEEVEKNKWNTDITFIDIES